MGLRVGMALVQSSCSTGAGVAGAAGGGGPPWDDLSHEFDSSGLNQC